MWRILIHHHLKASFRSPLMYGSMFAKVMSFIIGFFITIQLIGLGAAGPHLLAEKYPQVSLCQLVYGLILFFILFDLAMRSFMQKKPSLNLHPYLIQPIKRKQLSRFLLVKSWLNYCNLYQHIFLIPFTLVFSYMTKTWHLFFQHYAIILVLLFINHHFTLILHYIIKPFMARFIPILLLTAGVTIQYSGSVDLFRFSQKSIVVIMHNPALSLTIALVAMVAITVLINRFISTQMYNLLDNSQNKKTQKTLSLQKRKNPYLFLFTTLILRNKRLRTSSYSFLLLWLLCILYIFNSPVEESAFFSFFWLIIFFSPGIIIAQFLNSWESSFFDALMVNKFDWKRYYTVHYYSYLVASGILFFPIIPFIFWFQPETLGLTLTALLFACGFAYPLVFLTSVFNRKKIDLQRSSFGNMQGSGTSQFLSIMGIFYLTPIIYVILVKLLPEFYALLILAFIGITGILTHQQWLGLVSRKNAAKKYIRLENYKD